MGKEAMNDILAFLEAMMGSLSLLLSGLIAYHFGSEGDPSQAQVPSVEIIDLIIGPSGVVVLLLVIVYVLYKYAKEQKDKYDQIQNKLMEEKDRENERLRELVNQLNKDLNSNING